MHISKHLMHLCCVGVYISSRRSREPILEISKLIAFKQKRRVDSLLKQNYNQILGYFRDLEITYNNNCSTVVYPIVIQTS